MPGRPDDPPLSSGNLRGAPALAHRQIEVGAQGHNRATLAEAEAVVSNGIYLLYFDALKAYGLNPGYLFEPMGKFNEVQQVGRQAHQCYFALGAKPEAGICARWKFNFDLDKWNPEYFARPKDFQSLKPAYVASWSTSAATTHSMAMHGQYPPVLRKQKFKEKARCDCGDAQILKHADLVHRDDEYVRKITKEANEFDHVIVEICDER